ncbi:MAG: GntR family transcriptional regulator [Marvinbryantia sp.]|jgi:DNA-binding GntR family transcriptional regulator
MTEQLSLPSMVFRKIKEDILNGRYKENEELRETALGKELGVSRTPVREALRQLQLEGLVEIIPNRGAFVKGITAKDVEDIYNIRARLEGLCARMAAEAVSQEQLDHLMEIILLAKFYEKQKDYAHLAVMDSQFHEVLYEACGSKMLQNLLTDYHQYVHRVRRHSLEHRERAIKSTLEHEAILNAIRMKDAALADELATKHVLNTIQNIRQYGITQEQEEKNE